jgi:hypothetical protein
MNLRAINMINDNDPIVRGGQGRSDASIRRDAGVLLFLVVIALFALLIVTSA